MSKNKLIIAASITAALTAGPSAMAKAKVKCYGHKDIPLGKNACQGALGKSSCAGKFQNEYDRPQYWMLVESESACTAGGGRLEKFATSVKGKLFIEKRIKDLKRKHEAK